jgi:hypothetical protein
MPMPGVIAVSNEKVQSKTKPKWWTLHWIVIIAAQLA